MNPQKHLQNLSSLDGYLNSYWLDETGVFMARETDSNGKNIKAMMERTLKLREKLSSQTIIKKIEQLVILGRRKIVIHQFMGRPGNRILLTSILESNVNITKVKVKLYAIAENCLW